MNGARPVIRILLAACALVLAAVPTRAQSAEAWRTDVGCTMVAPGSQAAAPAEATYHPRAMEVAGCPTARCIALPGGRRVCGCGSDTVVVTRLDDDGRLLNEWADEAWSHVPDPSSFSVTRADLDGDAHPELVVARFMAMGPGLAGRLYSVAIVDGADPTRPPVRLSVDEYSPHGSLARPAGGGPCRVLATRWQRLRDPGRGEGTYLVGQWMRYRAGRLEHDPGRPVIVHPREGFDDEELPGPLAHFHDAHARVWRGMPLRLPGRAGERMSGTVLQARGGTLDLSITPQRVLQLTFEPGMAGPGAESHAFWLVDRATGRPYPPGYAAGDPDWLRGAPVEIIHYRDARENVHLVVVGPQASGQSP